MHTYSYDIFDTCLLRICGKQDFVFEQLALDILGTNTCESLIQDFVLVRRNGENEARKIIRNTDVEDITIEDIYNHCDFSPYCQCSKQEILEKELQIHKHFLVPINDTLEEIQNLHLWSIGDGKISLSCNVCCDDSKKTLQKVKKFIQKKYKIDNIDIQVVDNNSSK